MLSGLSIQGLGFRVRVAWGNFPPPSGSVQDQVVPGTECGAFHLRDILLKDLRLVRFEGSGLGWCMQKCGISTVGMRRG